MPKKEVRSNFRVEIYPRAPSDYGHMSIGGGRQSEEEAIARCEELLDDIKAHVDKSLVPSRGSIGTVVWDVEYVCEYCGAVWTEDSDRCNGGCCSKDAVLLEEEN